ncbi:FAD:protein FMN transferase [Olivibacter domesticus]|uniref:FAD:protein FMN transferase n=1 Tax=Olivibacter domesticus TaxID=407022 RepID=A0A1H7I5X2_OLID1|nr:FAD:protein FMN transferase [Olivibacter domesticus]SEK57916.1 thiamine biosynthesis lipoprotein [Olivibacter domesticus]
MFSLYNKTSRFSFTKGFVIVLFVCLFCSFNVHEEQKYSLTGLAQGTSYNISYYSNNEKIKKETVDSILAVIDSSMSLYKPYSVINKFNNSKEGIEIDENFRTVLKKSLQVYDDTQGVFDITVAPLVQAWGFGVNEIDNYPTPSTIKTIKNCVGSNLLKLNGSYLAKVKPCVKIDMNGIAQGYSVDLVADYLLKLGISQFVVEIGGELRISGVKPDGTLMRIGIEGPGEHDQTPEIRHIIGLENGAITTSGNYRKFKQNGSKKITHLIDPRTGYPIENNLISVTLYANKAITADGYDNAIMAMDIKKALKFVETHNELEAYIIYHNEEGKVVDTMTTGFKKLLIDE